MSLRAVAGDIPETLADSSSSFGLCCRYCSHCFVGYSSDIYMLLLSSKTVKVDVKITGFFAFTETGHCSVWWNKPMLRQSSWKETPSKHLMLVIDAVILFISQISFWCTQNRLLIIPRRVDIPVLGGTWRDVPVLTCMCWKGHILYWADSWIWPGCRAFMPLPSPPPLLCLVAFNLSWQHLLWSSVPFSHAHLCFLSRLSHLVSSV